MGTCATCDSRIANAVETEMPNSPWCVKMAHPSVLRNTKLNAPRLDIRRLCDDFAGYALRTTARETGPDA